MIICNRKRVMRKKYILRIKYQVISKYLETYTFVESVFNIFTFSHCLNGKVWFYGAT